jgi:hypothetical protein
MAKKVEVRILEFFPQLKRSSTWEEAWDLMVDSTEIEGALEVIDTAKEKKVVFELYNHGQKVTEFNPPFDKFVNPDTTFNMELALKEAFDYCIKYKLIRKPRKGEGPVDKLTSLRDERDRLTMRIYNWRQDGKDVTELLKQKEILVARIKELA